MSPLYTQSETLSLEASQASFLLQEVEGLEWPVWVKVSFSIADIEHCKKKLGR
jgi:hypothetical protein